MSGHSVSQPLPSTHLALASPFRFVSSEKRSWSDCPTSFHSKSSTLPSKKGPSSGLSSEPRKPSERLAGEVMRTRRSAGTYAQVESRAHDLASQPFGRLSRLGR